MNAKTYPKHVKETATKSSVFRNCCNAFFFGGTICLMGQGLRTLYLWLAIPMDQVKILVPASLILLAALLTGIGVFDRIAKHAGAGTLVPITGFANAVAAPAIDTTAEGLVLGLGAKIFTIAGPVILYGTFASVIYGVIYYFTL